MRRKLAHIAGVLGAVTLSFAVVLAGPARPAAAFGEVSPTVVKTAMRTLPKGALVVTGAACSTGVGCLATGAVMLGVTAYATRDSWMPIVEQLISGSNGEWGDNPDPVQLLEASILTSEAGRPYVSATGYWKVDCCEWEGPDPHWFNVREVNCVSPVGILEQTYMAYPGLRFGDGQGHPLEGTKTGYSADLCAKGWSLSSAIVRFNLPYGSAEVLVEGASDALADFHTATTDVICKRPDGSTFNLSDSETGQTSRVAIPSCYEADPTSIPWEVTTKGAPGTTTAAPTIIHIQTDPDVYEDYGDCFNELGLVCDIKVWVGGVPCAVGVAGCADWFQNQNSPEVQCKFGPYVVDMDNCTALKRSYKPGVGDQTITDPTTWVPDPNQPDPDPDPPVDPETPPSTPPDVVNPPTIDPLPPDVNPDSSNCLGGTVSWNPVNWVYVPVKCALIWAFRPDVSVQTRVQTVQTAFNGKAPFSWASGLGSIPSLVPGGSCPDWRIKVGTTNRNVVCGQSYTNAVVGMRPVLFAFMASLAVWPLIRSVYYGSIPIIRANAGKL